MKLLPDMPGRVHGIKHDDPFLLQCDGCGLLVEHDGIEPLIIFIRKIRFDRSDQYRRRMCGECWAAEGVYDR